ncbi:CHAT domain-containing protein [Arthrobacter ginkgonis]|uniref:CHAT domain-containing protein n=1 Tax=Arthrobacter ginkgonis TaxID=1630594 RepID=UPI0031E802F5
MIHAPAGGETSGTFQLDVEAVLGRLAELEATVLASAIPARRTIPAGEKPLHEVGQQLFQALFTGQVEDTYRASLGVIHDRSQRLRVVLRLAAPKVAALPWEMLFDPATESYLCHDLPLLRRIPAADYNLRPLEVTPPLRILGIVAAPHDLPGLDTDAERQHLDQALAKPVADGLIELVWAPRATWDGIQTTLMDGPWHVLHFIGHGDYDVNRQEGRIALESDTGRADRVESSRLMYLLHEAEPTPRLVVLNSCSSGEAGTEDLFSGTAAALVRGGISAVAAMQFTVSDRAAIAFARGFYAAIAHGRDVDRAAGSGRRSILGLGTLEWVTPVLYVRGGSTQLFTLTGRPVSLGLEIQPPVALPARRQAAQLRALYLHARAELRTKHYGQAIELLDDLLTLEPGYSDAAELRKTAAVRQEMAETYRAAREAEDAGDWEAAVHGYALVRDDPDFADAAARREACAVRQRATDLEDELRLHAGAGNWHAVLEVAAELQAVDPEAVDPDGLAARARLEVLYTGARQAEEAGDRDAAGRAYAEILTADPTFRDTAVRHDTLRSSAQESSDSAQSSKPTRSKARERRSSISGTGMASGTQALRVRHDNPIIAVAFSRDGTRLATGSNDSTARIWDATKGKELMRVHHASAVLAVTFGPDRTILATGSGDYTACIWDAIKGKELRRVRSDGWIKAVDLGPNGDRLAAGSRDKTARIWDAATGQELLRVRHDGVVNAVAFSMSGTRLATGSGDKTARIWDAATGQKLMQVHHGGSVLAVAFSPDGTLLATGSDDGSARISDAATGQKLMQVHHDGFVYAVAFSPDGTLLASGSGDRTARIWDATTGQELMRVRHEGAVNSVAFSMNGSRLATASDDKTARIWKGAVLKPPA